MIPLHIQDSTRALAKEQKEYLTLHIRDEFVYGVPMMTSLWELSPKDLANALNGGQLYVRFMFANGPVPALLRKMAMEELVCLHKGGRCILSIPGKIHPPVWFGIISAEEALQCAFPEAALCAVGVQRAPELVDG